MLRKLYQDRTNIKWASITFAFVIGAGSIFYTNTIIESLSDREKKFIDLFARTIEYTSNETNRSNLTFLNQEIVVSNETIPVILTDALENPVLWRNLDMDTSMTVVSQQRYLRKQLAIMKKEHEPIVITFRDEQGEVYDYQYVFYKNSFLLSQLRYYPYVQLSIIFVFAILAYLAFSYSKTAEQNKVWVGLAKETAHQLGTPLSSLMAWLEYLKADENFKDQELVKELDKDIVRLNMITERFSNIGSVPMLDWTNVHEVVNNTVQYLRTRLSSKIRINVRAMPVDIRAQMNKPLFEWVIENILKNAVDAMSGEGVIDINIKRGKAGDVVIDIKDEGKGIAKSKIKEVFQPGYTTKQRGWGLGLALAKRIIDNYHDGKIFVKFSEPDVGTTFRIVLK
ncbi:MAG: ATP-binding protein [Bacteroidota bacterium]